MELTESSGKDTLIPLGLDLAGEVVLTTCTLAGEISEFGNLGHVGWEGRGWVAVPGRILGCRNSLQKM